MNPPIAPDPRARVEEFRRKHRIGLVALLFTDIVGSTRLKQVLGDHEAISLIQRHHAVVREILSGFSEGQEIETAGDSFFLVFAKPSDAVKFSLLLQSRLRALDKQRTVLVSDRIGIHVGEVFIGEEEKADSSKHLYGIQVDTCARVMSLAQGDQILMTRFAFDNARQVLRGEELPGINELNWLNHGHYLVKGLEEAIEICEVGEAGDASLKAPSDAQKAQRQIAPDTEPVVGWRPALEQVVPRTKWILEKKLGEGAFGEVWLGRHEILEERRVFKFCFRADRVRSLKREVTLFRILKERVGQHPNIVGIQEVFFDEPPFYIVMDYAEGQDLKTWSAERGGVASAPLAIRLEIVAQVADALHAAHEAGVIHRDVKPSNILITGCRARNADLDPGIRRQAANQSHSSSSSSSSTNTKSEIRDPKLEVKLTDFGIGQVVSQEALAGITRMGFTQTMLPPGSSSQTGTHLYMAPELFAGQPASTRSDIYSLGVVFYQLLIGDFTRPLTMDWAKRISDPLLREDLEKCFAGNPQERFMSAGELARSLRSLPQRQAERAACERSAQRRWIARVAAIVGIILTALFALGVLAAKWSGWVQRNSDERVGTKNPQAIDFYNRGKSYVFSNSSKDELKKAVDWFEQAVALDPKFARAYVNLGYAYRQLDTVWEPRRGWDAKALQAADKALLLDKGLADAWVIRGALFFTPAQGWDAVSDVKYQRKAIILNPNVKNAHLNLAFVYGHIGFLKEAIAELDQELKSYPLDPTPRWIRGWILVSEGDYQEALQDLAQLPEQAFFHPRIKAWLLSTCFLYLGKTNDASKVLDDGLTKLPGDPLLLSTLAIIDAKRGLPDKAKEKIGKAKEGENRFIHFHHVSYNIGSVYALLDEKKPAMEWLTNSVEDGNPCYPCFTHDPNLQNLRGDLGFEAFLRELKDKYEQNREILLKP